MLTTDEIISKGIVTRVSHKFKHSVGLTVGGISSISGIGVITNADPTLPVYTKIESKESSLIKKKGWYLEAGIYAVIFNEGCNIPNMHLMGVIQKSELSKSGANIYPISTEMILMGFKTDNIKMILQVTIPIFIEKGIVLSQVYINPQHA